MIPTRLTLSNLGSFRGEHDLDLSDLDLVVLVGGNGNGKSTLVEAVGWVLFGDWRGSSVDDVITRGERECRAALEFEVAGERYRVERVRRAKGKPELHFQVCHPEPGEGSPSIEGDSSRANRPAQNDNVWLPLDGNTVADTQARICERLSLTGDLWRRTAMVAQEEAGLFSRATPADRKRILFEVLEFDRFEHLLLEVKSRVGETGEGMAARAALIQMLEDDADGIPATEEALQDLSARHQEAQARLAERAATLTGVRAQGEALAADTARAEELTSRLRDVRARESSQSAALSEQQATEKTLAAATAGDSQTLRQQGAAVGTLETELAEAESSWQSLASARSFLQVAESDRDSATRAWEARRKALQTQIADYAEQGALCDRVPCAGTDLGPQCQLLAGARERRAAVGGLEASLESEGAAFEAEDKRRRAAVDLAIATHQTAQGNTTRCRPADTIRQELTTARRAREQVNELAVAADRLAAVRERLPALEGDLAVTRKQIIEVCAQLKPLAEVERRRQELTAAIATAERDLATADAELADLARHVGGAEQELARLRTAAETLPRRKAELFALERRIAVLTFLRDAFGVNGIPALLLDQALPELEAQANEVLALFSDGRMSIRLDTQRAKATGGLAESLEIIISQDGIERDYATFSGGERMRIDLGLRIGLSRMLANRAGARCETLILDETAAPLDDEGRHQLIECLALLRSEQVFQRIFLVTHLEELRDAFPARIVVSREGGGSRAVVER